MRCVHCGNGLKSSDATCGHCGARVVRPSEEAASGGGGSAARLVAAAAALIGLGAAALVIWPARDAIVRGLDEYLSPSPPSPRQVGAATPDAAAVPAPVSAEPAAPTPAAVPPPPALQPARIETPARSPVPEAPAARRPAAATTRREAPAPAPTAVAPARAPRPSPIRVGGNIAAPRKVKDVPPVYPPMAIQARVQGVVIIEAMIGPDGAVDAVKILRSIPLLDEAALDAVRQWEFTPTLLNGAAVPVIMTVTVNFTLK